MRLENDRAYGFPPILRSHARRSYFIWSEELACIDTWSMSIALYTLVNAFTSTCIFSLPRGLLVVITMTPLAERAPQMEAAAASFNTVIDSTSLGLMLEKSLPIMGKPSTTTNGCCAA